MRELRLILTPPVVAAVVVFMYLWLFSLIDIARSSKKRWVSVGRSQWAWFLLTIIPGVAIYYLLKIRPDLFSPDFQPVVLSGDGGGADAASRNGASLTFEGIGMTFPDGTEALRDISFSVDKGEFVTVVGPSGCGKSTLLRIASGLLRQTAGSVSVDRHRLGYVFQDATLFPWRTVRGNIELLAELHDIDAAERQRLATQAIELVGLTGFENHYPKSLSGGMRMRCSLARTLTLKPPVFLFDEPFGAVDEITREHLNEETQQLFQSEGFAGLFITHSIREAVFMSTKVYVMSARPGRLIAEFDVPFPYPRNPDLRFDPEFAELSGDVSHALRGSHS
jgi:NitT/TauT family transport system ATP-binding protein